MPKIVDHDAYRHELVEKASYLFAERGYGNLGMRDIAAALGISKSALYHYFPGKEALFRAVMEATIHVDLESFAAYRTPNATRRERLQILLRYCADNETWFVRQYLIVMDYLHGKTPTEIREQTILPKATELYITFIQDYLGLERKLVIGIIAFINGLFIQRLFDGQTTNYAEMADWLLDHFTEWM